MEQLPPDRKASGLHVLSKWSLALTCASVLFFVVPFIVAANSPKSAQKDWHSDLWAVEIFVIAPLCLLGAAVTGIIGAVKRKGCFALGIVLIPVLVLGLMVLFLWIGLIGASRFR